ncbi:uncharacterized protein LOC142983541 [Anticarsia gemmatalis]|uniref:uncharacterized protein LOC142983541 n=1 Tax=Anticarsia gemmatalis TaxID=129554 RepID=UPI003F75AEAF
MMMDFELPKPAHELLERGTPAYTSVTVRRAFIVWLHCGQTNEFRHVCNYYHYLEAMENILSPESRATSRLHEFNLIACQPPGSEFLTTHFPKLYRQNKQSKLHKQLDEARLEETVFNTEGFHDIKIQKGINTKDIIKTSQLIRKYCKIHKKSLKNFLLEFHDFAKKSESNNSVNNISVYIKKKFLEDDLVTFNSMPRHFSFLDDDTNILEAAVDVKSPIVEDVNKNANKIRILINESRKKDLMSLFPQLTGLSLDDRNSKISSENLIAAKIIEDHKTSTSDVYEFVNKI